MKLVEKLGTGGGFAVVVSAARAVKPAVQARETMMLILILLVMFKLESIRRGSRCFCSIHLRMKILATDEHRWAQMILKPPCISTFNEDLDGWTHHETRDQKAESGGNLFLTAEALRREGRKITTDDADENSWPKKVTKDSKQRTLNETFQVGTPPVW
jgi:hypothetical protein